MYGRPAKQARLPSTTCHRADNACLPLSLGGRTAWSSQVKIFNNSIAARYWYDGNNVQNAKEDAAEVAYNWLTSMINSY